MKKTILIFMSALTLSASAQDSATVKKDDMTGEYLASAPRSIICMSDDREKGFKLFMGVDYEKNRLKYSGVICLSYNIGSCVEHDNLIFLFEDGTNYTTPSSWNDFNCKGYSYFDFKGKDMMKLNKRIKAIRFTNGRTSDYYTHYLSPEDADAFMANIDAIVNNRIKWN